MKKILLSILCLICFINLYSQNIGIGTISPSDKLHINSGTGEDPLRVQINGSTKLRINNNGGTSIGILSTPPVNGLLVQGSIQPQGGIETPAKLIVESTGDSIILNAGGSQIILAADGNITIKTTAPAKIAINAGSNLELTGTGITLQSATSLNLQAATTISMSASQLNLNGIIRFNGGSRKIAGVGDVVGVSGSTGTITTGSPNVFTN